MTTVDPVTAVLKTQTLISSSTDTYSATVSGSWTEVHTSSLGQSDTDVITGSSTSTGTESASSSLSTTVTLVGMLATGERVNLTNKYVQNDNSSDGFVLTDGQTSNGTDTQTASVNGTFNIPTIYNAVYGTISTTDPSSGITTTTMLANVIDTSDTETVANLSTTVTPASGTAATTPINTGTGTLQQGWLLTTIIYQTSAAGALVGSVTTSTDQGSNTGTDASGTITNPGLTNTHLDTTTTAGTTIPTLPPIPAPGALIGAQPNADPPAGAQQGANPNANAVQQAAQDLQNRAMTDNKNKAKQPGQAAGGSPPPATPNPIVLGTAKVVSDAAPWVIDLYSDNWQINKSFYIGMAQGAANIIEGLQNKLIGPINLTTQTLMPPIDATGHPVYPLGEYQQRGPIIFRQVELLPEQNWRNTFAPETDLEHKVSTTLGSEGAAFLIPVGIGKAAGVLSELRSASQLATTKNLPSLEILNPSYRPNGSQVLQNLTTQVNKELSGNLPLALTVLSDEEVAAAAGSSGIARLQYGNALERLVKIHVEADPILDSYFMYVGGPRKPDFIGKGILKGMNFDITTPSQIDVHLARPGYGEGLNVITYERPVGFP